jgi:ribosomal-protein-alanine N-acetyltransferase
LNVASDSRFVLDTGRLTLRPVSSANHAGLHALFTQPGVRRFIFDEEIVPPEQTSEIISRSEELFRTRRFGLWLAGLAGLAIGFGGFWYFRDPPDLELLYGVGDAHVKQGYGREIARAVVHYGFTTLEMPEIRASTDAAHAESRRLLQDLGFVVERQAVVGGLETVFFAYQRDAYQAKHDVVG